MPQTPAFYYQQKIYVNNKPLVLTNRASVLLAEDALAKGYLLLTGAFRRNYRVAMEHIARPGSLGAIIEDESTELLWTQLLDIYRPVRAGGGVVFNEQEEPLMIFRRGKWDLPKGKLDEGEEIDACAVREVCEETGLQHVTIGKKICDTYHIYNQDKTPLLKHTEWFHMRGTVADALQPQEEENIQEAKWVRPDELPRIVATTYGAVREVLAHAGVVWK